MQPIKQRLCFYQHQVLHLQLSGALSRTLMRTQNCPIAEVGAGNASLLGTDRQGSVLFLDTGDHTRAFNYSAFGYDAVGNEKESMLGFCQQPREPLTGFYLLGQGYRAYHPGLQRFSSPDRYSPFEEGGINPYAYCNDDPVNLTDPTGKAGAPVRMVKAVALDEFHIFHREQQPNISARRPQQPGFAPAPVAAPMALNNRQPLGEPLQDLPLPINSAPAINNTMTTQAARRVGNPPTLALQSSTLSRLITGLRRPIIRLVRRFHWMFSQQAVNNSVSTTAPRPHSTALMHASQRQYRQAQSRSTQRPSDHNREIRQ
ncbi:RHS repeat-associated core domain-containing protein [Pseudomonas sp. TWI929]|uniref:RHS repeat-associated core domain-containing protein n=1 Tax=Pseudomonas sp. TWI929 TaxID=3136795 RepID=UPI00320B8996